MALVGDGWSIVLVLGVLVLTVYVVVAVPAGFCCWLVTVMDICW